MIYLIYSKEREMARRSALKILKKDYPVRDEGNYVSFNMAVTPIEQLVDECNSLSLMSEKKAIFAEDCAFLAKQEKAKKKQDKSLDALAQYCLHPNEEIDLFLVVYAETLDGKNKVVEAIATNGYTKEVPVPSEEEWISYALRYLKKNGSDIDEGAAKELVKRIDGDYGRFLAELAKLDAYASGQKLTFSDIQALVSPRLEEDSLELSNMLLSGNIERCIRVYGDLKKHSIDEIRLMNMLSNQFRFLDQVSYLSFQGKNKFDIAKDLAASPYRVEICLRNLRSIRPNAPKIMLERLYRCEKAVLSGEQNPEFAFTRFLAETSL